MDWFLSRFRARNRARPALVCYLRENGPIAYGTAIFGKDPRERADAMLATDLTWYWRTGGAEPRSRDWTHLTRWSLGALLVDLAGGQDGLKPHILVVGVDDSGHDAPEEMTDGRVAAWMRAFGGAAQGPLHVVVSHPGPGGDLLFVAQQPPESVRNLLQAWGIDRDRAERKAYARLQGRALEDLTRSLRP